MARDRNQSESVDPLAGFSRGPVIDGPGIYANTGPSPYTIEFVRPTRELLRGKLRGESIIEFLERQPLTEAQLREYALSGLPEAQEKPSEEKPPTKRLLGRAALKSRHFGVETPETQAG